MEFVNRPTSGVSRDRQERPGQTPGDVRRIRREVLGKGKASGSEPDAWIVAAPDGFRYGVLIGFGGKLPISDG